MKPVRLVRGFLTVGGWTFGSRLLGFVRDMMIAAYLGSGPVAEAFLVSFSLPNMFRRFFAEGAFNMAFVPMFAKKLEAGDDPKGFAQDAFSGLSAVLILFTVLGTLAMPWLVWAMASGFHGDERFTLAVLYGRIGFSYILFISLVALLSGVLNAFGHFTEASLVPVLMNLMFIVAMWMADKAGWDMGLTLAWTVPATGVAQFAFTWVSAQRLGFALWPGRPRITPELKRLLIIAGPAVLAATREEEAHRYLGPDGPRLSAAIALGGDGPAAYARGAPPAGQAWEMRAGLLCAALAAAAGEVRLGACRAGLGVGQPLARATPPTRH